MPPGRGRGGSRYSLQLEEKRNLKNIFGIREAQLRRYYQEARAGRGKETGAYLIELLERRLDNALFRAGFAETRGQARQMASHKLVTVYGRPVNVPSLRLRTGDVVQVKESKRGKSYFANFEKKMQNAQLPAWLQSQPTEFSFRGTGSPSVEEAKLAVDAQAVVELLSR
jgi:small subunit ribosomal protein S4